MPGERHERGKTAKGCRRCLHRRDRNFGVGTSFRPTRLGAQVLRNPTPYHLRYDDVPSDQNSPYWPKDLVAVKLFRSISRWKLYQLHGGDRERVEHSSNPFA
jgi:hypothetical protein